MLVNQSHLEKVVRRLFPSEIVHTNARTLAAIKDSSTGGVLEVDVWLPSLHLSFEFQVEYHYFSTYYTQLPLEDIRAKDNVKKWELQRKGETLVVVPYWWTGEVNSLMSTLQFLRPEIDFSYYYNNNHSSSLLYSSPISLNPVCEFNAGGIPDVQELMLSTFDHHQQFISPATPWWIGEKYDGIRFCWHPGNQSLYSRTGFVLLPTLPSNFGNLFLDGEIWCGRGHFHETISLMRSESLQDNNILKLIAFDEPSSSFQNKSFETRFAALVHNISVSHPLLTIAFRILCSEYKSMKMILEEILERSGEGVILRKYSTLYERGKSTSLIKIKHVANDAEALVIDASDSTIKLQLPNGNTFEVISNAPLKKGNIVTFNFTKMTQHHIPIDPVISRVREDISWTNVIAQYNKEKRLPKTNKPASRSLVRISDRSRVFFEEFAKERKFDPLVVSNWYTITQGELAKKKSNFLRIFKGKNWVQVLMAAFPQLKFEAAKFIIKHKDFWQSFVNQRKFLVSFAQQRGFDPLKPENWHDFLSTFKNRKDLRNTRLVKNINKNINKTLTSVFPDIGFDSSRLGKHLENEINQRKFLVSFARQKGFDPLIARNWQEFLLSPENRKELSSSPLVLSTYSSNVDNALLHVFPDIGLIPWRVFACRLFFEGFARERDFNPLEVSNWYRISRTEVLQSASNPLKAYKGSLAHALMASFPELQFELDKFTHKYNYWKNETNQRNFFISFAQEKGFDPYSQASWQEYLSVQHNRNNLRYSHFVKSYFNGSIRDVLHFLFSSNST